MDHTAQLGDLLINIYKHLKTRVERDLKLHDIGMGQLQILMLLFSQMGQTVTQSDMVKMIGVDKGNISRSLQKLLTKGYIELDPSNTRSYQLTAVGVQLKQDIMAVFTNIHERMTQGIESQEVRQTVMTLTKISKNLEDAI